MYIDIKYFGLWPTELTVTYLNGPLSGHNQFQVNNNAKERLRLWSNVCRIRLSAYNARLSFLTALC